MVTYLWTMSIYNDLPRTSSFFFKFSCCSKNSQNGNQTQEDLIKFDYKTNKEVENLGIPLLARTY